MLKHVAETAAEKSLRTAGRAATPGTPAARGRAGVTEPRLTGTIRKGRKSVPPEALSSTSSSLLSKRHNPFTNEILQRHLGRIFCLKFNLTKRITTIRKSTASSLASAATTSPTFFGSAKEIASPVTHSALDFFEKPNVLIKFEGFYDQGVFPHVRCRGPQLDFFVTAEAKNLIDLYRILSSVKFGVYTEDGKTRAKLNEHPIVFFSNNTFHILFSHAELYLNGKFISYSNNCYLHAAFIETELTTDTEGKETWAKCQGYDYLPKSKEQDQAFNKIYADFDCRKECTAQLYGALHVDFFDCEKLLVPGVTLHLRLFRSPNNTLPFMKGTDEEAKTLDGKVQAVIERVSLFVRKVVVTDGVKLSFEKALAKGPAIYPYIESLSKSFINQAGQNCFVKENLFGTEPILWLTFFMVKNSLFRSTLLNHSPFFYQKFGVQRVEIQRCNRVPLAGTLLDTSNNVRLYYNTITGHGFAKSGNGIKVEDFE